MNTEAKVLARFAGDVEKHELTIKHDDGLYRHLVIKEPGTSIHWYEIVTTPGQLTIRGDMGTYAFAREQDMFDWFVDDKRAGNYINPGYWGEKLIAVDRHSAPREYSPEIAKQVIREQAEYIRDYAGLGTSIDFGRWVDDLVELVDTADDEQDLREQIARSTFNGYRFEDVHEWDFNDYSYHFIWCLHAIVFAIKAYRKAKRARAAEHRAALAGVTR